MMPIFITPFFYGSIIVSFLHDPKRDSHYLQIVFSGLRPLPWLKGNWSELILSFMRLSTMNKVAFSYAV